jgi:energy-coupling factor transporter transmembrane protein EcfT
MNKLPDFLLQKEPYRESEPSFRSGTVFIDKTIQKLADLVRLNYIQLFTIGKKPFISNLAIQTKLIVFLYFILLISLVKSLTAEIIIASLILLFHLITSPYFLKLLKRILFFTLIFGFLIAFPSSLHLVNMGKVVYPLLNLGHSFDFWIYHIPSVIGFTAEGLKGMGLLTFRVFNSISISLLFINTTPFNDIVKGLKLFRIPDSLLMIFSLSYLYVVILSNSILESYLALKARIFGSVDEKKIQQIVAGRISHIFKMSRRHFEKTYQAMLARGYTGEVVLYQKEKFTSPDYLLLGFVAVTGFIFYFIEL